MDDLSGIRAYCTADGDVNFLSGRLGYVEFWRAATRRFPQFDVDDGLRLLDRVGLLHMADKRADQFSGGQRQSVGIFRALIRRFVWLLGVAAFRWAINIRESTVLDLVGAGGIGLSLQASRDKLARPQVLLILAVVVISEWVSAKVRGAII